MTAWHVTDETGAEVELRTLLRALVGMLKPALIVETGAYRGETTYQLGLGCVDNGAGRVISCEPKCEYWMEAHARCDGLPVEIRQCASAEVPQLEEADFLFLDSDYRFRHQELGRVKRGATVVVHDAHKSYDPHLPPIASFLHGMGGLTWRVGLDGRGFGLLVRQ